MSINRYVKPLTLVDLNIRLHHDYVGIALPDFRPTIEWQREQQVLLSLYSLYCTHCTVLTTGRTKEGGGRGIQRRPVYCETRGGGELLIDCTSIHYTLY
jgi:hypothetical protein